MTYRILALCAAAVAIAGCDKTETAPGNQGVNNITVYDANSLPPDANITELPADDGDAPPEAETNSK